MHFAREDEDEGRFIFRFARRGNSLSTRLATATARLQSLVLPGQELSDSAKLLTDIIARLPSLKQTFRRIQPRVPIFCSLILIMHKILKGHTTFFWDKVLYSFSLSLILNQIVIQN